MHTRFVLVLLMALALLAAGCGTRVKEKTEAAGNGGLGGAAQPGDQSGGPGGTTANGSPAASGPKFGTLPVPCGPNTTGGALPATGVGVTESEIHVATI